MWKFQTSIITQNEIDLEKYFILYLIEYNMLGIKEKKYIKNKKKIRKTKNSFKIIESILHT